MQRFFQKRTLSKPRYYIYLPEVSKGRVFLLKEQYHYFKDVLRLKENDFIGVLDGQGSSFLAQVVEADKRKRTLKIEIKTLLGKEEKRLNTHLFCAVPKRNKFELIVEKGTELGVSSITPVICRYQQKIPSSGHFLERLRKISCEALEQSQGLFLPQIRDIMDFKPALKEAKQNSPVLVFDKDRGRDLKEVLPLLRNTSDISIFIGPEAGFSQEELDFAVEQKIEIVSLKGFNILRTETACITILAIILFFLRNG